MNPNEHRMRYSLREEAANRAATLSSSSSSTTTISSTSASTSLLSNIQGHLLYPVESSDSLQNEEPSYSQLKHTEKKQSGVVPTIPIQQMSLHSAPKGTSVTNGTTILGRQSAGVSTSQSLPIKPVSATTATTGTTTYASASASASASIRQSSSTTTTTSSLSQMTTSKAREQWRQHGENTSQILEHRRQALLQPQSNSHMNHIHHTKYNQTQQSHDASNRKYGNANNPNPNPDPDLNNYSNTSYTSFSQIQNVPPPRFSVRVISTEERLDPAGAGYTVYIIEVESLTSIPTPTPIPTSSHSYPTAPLPSSTQSKSQLPPSPPSPHPHPHLQKHQVARRYSDFLRLYKLLQSYSNSSSDSSIQLQFRSPFPSKSLAGRLGNWTPAIQWAPGVHHDLITSRKIQLDIWLVELAELLSRGCIPKECQEHVVQFLTRETELAPCHYHNHHHYNHQNHSNHQNPSNIQYGGGVHHSNNNNNHHHLNGRGTEGSSDSHQNGSIQSRLSFSKLYLPNPISFTMGSEIRKAITILHEMTSPPPNSNTTTTTTTTNPTNTASHSTSEHSPYHISDQSIPLDLLHQAWGLCFLTVLKAGCILSGRVGTGLLLSRSSDGGWSPPCAVGTVGMGWGMLMGGDLTSYLIVLNTRAAVKAFANCGSGEEDGRFGGGGGGSGGGSGGGGGDHIPRRVNLGAEVGIAVGPVGRGTTGNVNAGFQGEKKVVSAYSYAHSKGLFVGISLEGSVVKVRGDVNAKFYGRQIGAEEILFGMSRLGGGIERPRAAQGLYDALEEAMGRRIEGWRPSEAIRGLRNKNYREPASPYKG